MAQELSKEEAIAFFAMFYRGEHHLPAEVKHYGYGWSILDRNSFSTYDFNGLTRLVVMAHDKAFRVELVPKPNNKMLIAIWKRRRDGGMTESHPTLESHVEGIREQHEVWLKNNPDYDLIPQV